MWRMAQKNETFLDKTFFRRLRLLEESLGEQVVVLELGRGKSEVVEKKGDGCVTLGVGCEPTLKTKVTHETSLYTSPLAQPRKAGESIC